MRAGLVGETLTVSGLGENQSSALLRVNLTDGILHQAVFTASEPEFTVPEEGSAGSVALDYTWLGAEHIWAGPDHLLFVMGLLLLVGWNRRLIYTVTAFTLGHSVTLAMVTLGLFDYPVSLVEFMIALSIYVLAVELARGGWWCLVAATVVVGRWLWSAPRHRLCWRLGRDRVAAVECAGRLAVLQCWYRAGPAGLYRITGRDRGGQVCGLWASASRHCGCPFMCWVDCRRCGALSGVSKPSPDPGVPRPVSHWNDGMERDRQPLVDLVLVLQHIAAAHEGRPASGVDGVGDFHTAFTPRKHAPDSY